MKAVVFLILFLVMIILFLIRKEVFSSKQPKYVFWTGGYDSTYLVLKNIIIDNSDVVPFYLTGNVDNIEGKKYRRKNTHKELEAINHVYRMLREKFPDKYNKLGKLIQVHNKEIKLSDKVNKYMHKLYKKKKFGRPVCQYNYLSQFSLDKNIPIQLGVLGTEKFYKNNFLNKRKHAIFKHFEFPLANLSKKKLYAISKKHNFNDILRKSWSCWFPKENGEPCKKCPMCKQRVI